MKITRNQFFLLSVDPIWLEAALRENLFRELKDNLRYDAGFILVAEAAWPVALPEGVPVCFPTLRGTAGATSPGPTKGKWGSKFTLRPVTIDSRELTDVQNDALISFRPTVWFTFRHPRTAGGPEDYSRFVPLNLERFLNAKNLSEIEAFWGETVRV